MSKPFSQACANNQDIICDQLQPILEHKKYVLEVGSGTGQHGVWFARKMPHLSWQLSDRIQNHAGINMWVDEFPSPNLLPPIALDVLQDLWPATVYDAVYSANTAHIMPWEALEAMFSGIGRSLLSGGVFCLYGPMKYMGVLEAQSNVAFDTMLRQQNPFQGIREFEDINHIAARAGLVLMQDNAMPANNRLIVWQKK
ncbi:MAG: DUF938 domain-containing protein [Oceanospirillaceae bacterium]|nr:DUF938 domain-containing protein [Oceanospirillaceae bacterium]